MSGWIASQDLLLGGVLAGLGGARASRASRLKMHVARHASVTSVSCLSAAAVGAAWVAGDQDWPQLRFGSATSGSPSTWFSSSRSSAWAAAQKVCESLAGEGEREERSSMEARDFTVGRFQFKDFKVLGGKRLKAHGCCHLKYYGWEVCAAVLYLPEDVERPLSGSDVTDPSLPKMLELRYCRSFLGEQFRWVTRWAMSRNGHRFDEAEEAKLKSFNSLYRDVAVGDCYTLGYDPARGEGGRVTLQLNGCELGGVEGRHFSEAIFSVWFGQRPFLDQMKQELLEAQELIGTQ
mmetsp:Transcript_25627/g.56073  ORF Transcript_25627/g.56073 Transcript_25627/m.56073 type:complete len:292 (+) Transcript_25627:53-928(+)